MFCLSFVVFFRDENLHLKTPNVHLLHILQFELLYNRAMQTTEIERPRDSLAVRKNYLSLRVYQLIEGGDVGVAVLLCMRGRGAYFSLCSILSLQAIHTLASVRTIIPWEQRLHNYIYEI